MAEDLNHDMRRWAGPVPPPTLSELVDRYAVSQLVKIYALGIDMRDYELCRSAFAPDAEAQDRVGGMASIEVYLPKIFAAASSFQTTQHNITNQYITVTGDEAAAWSYAVAYHKPGPGDDKETITVGVMYRDVCRRYPQGWLINERRAAIQWTERTASRSP
jgi:hypothetical protein